MTIAMIASVAYLKLALHIHSSPGKQNLDSIFHWLIYTKRDDGVWRSVWKGGQ